MKIAITGCTGIIGRQLFPLLLSTYKNAEFIVIGRNKRNIENNLNLRNLNLDLLNLTKETAANIFKKEKIDYFFHLAWSTEHSEYLNSDNNKIWERSSIILIEEFYKFGGRKFIGVGTSLEYDWNYPPPFQEYQTPLTGNACKYGEAKLNVFNHLSHKSKNFSYLWLRVFFVFGPGQAKTRFIPLLINSLKNKEAKISVNKKLKQDYLSTFEIAKQIMMMLQTDYSGPVNISSGKSMTLGEIINSVSFVTGGKIQVSESQDDECLIARDVYGSLDVIKRYYPDYAYNIRNFETDLQKMINII